MLYNDSGNALTISWLPEVEASESGDKGSGLSHVNRTEDSLVRCRRQWREHGKTVGCELKLYFMFLSKKEGLLNYRDQWSYGLRGCHPQRCGWDDRHAPVWCWPYENTLPAETVACVGQSIRRWAKTWDSSLLVW